MVDDNIVTVAVTEITDVSLLSGEASELSSVTASDDLLYQAIIETAENTRQSANCLTTILAFCCVWLFSVVGKFLYHSFKKILF